MFKKDNYETLWNELRQMLREESSREGQKITLYSVLLYMDGAEAALKKRIAQRNYDAYGMGYAMGQIRYASSMDINSPYNLCDWGTLYQTFMEAKEKGATQIKWDSDRCKWTFRQTSEKQGNVHTVMRDPYLTPKMQKMLCYIADNDLF